MMAGYREKKVCRECGKDYDRTLRRGLCQRCYERPEIRSRHKTGTPYYRNRKPIAAAEPTAAQPGSLDKQLVLARRFSLHQPLFQRSEPALPLDEMAYAGNPYANDGRGTNRAEDHAELWRILALHDPGILACLEQLATERRRPCSAEEEE